MEWVQEALPQSPVLPLAVASNSGVPALGLQCLLLDSRGHLVLFGDRGLYGQASRQFLTTLLVWDVIGIFCCYGQTWKFAAVGVAGWRMCSSACATDREVN